MPFTYDPTTDIGMVRLLITDTDPARPIFSDDSAITAFLTLNDSDVRLAAAQALDVMATNEAMVLKVIRNMDLQTDGARVADSLRVHASVLRQQAAADSEGAIDYAEVAVDVFSARDIITREAMRRGSS